MAASFCGVEKPSPLAWGPLHKFLFRRASERTENRPTGKSYRHKQPGSIKSHQRPFTRLRSEYRYRYGDPGGKAHRRARAQSCTGRSKTLRRNIFHPHRRKSSERTGHPDAQHKVSRKQSREIPALSVRPDNKPQGATSGRSAADDYQRSVAHPISD